MSRIRPQESEEWYRTLFEQNPLPMWVFDLDTLQFLAVNQSAVRHYGYSLDEFLSMTLTNIRPKEDIAVLLHDLAAIPERGMQGSVRRHKKKDGGLIQVEVYARDLVVENRRAHRSFDAGRFCIRTHAECAADSRQSADRSAIHGDKT